MGFFNNQMSYPLGVQIKTGEDPPVGEMTVGSYNKRGKFAVNDNPDKVKTRLFKLAGQENVPVMPAIASKIEEKRGRNKFETEKPAVESRVFRNDRFVELKHRPDRRRFEENKSLMENRRDVDRRERERRDRDRTRFVLLLYCVHTKL